MSATKPTKGELHPRNAHRGSYDFDALIEAHSPLARFVTPNKYGTPSINFFDTQAVRTLNRAILTLHYKLEWWELPDSALIPPIPGRADYIHYVADLIENQQSARCLDIGVGASCIYPIIGRAEYGWEFVGSDISAASLECASRIIENNALLKGQVHLRQQRNKSQILNGIIEPDDRFDMTICNPPFHDSAAAAQQATRRKLRGLGVKGNKPLTLNFAGQDNELWCPGGERAFVGQIIAESRLFAEQCKWFTSLISSEDNLRPLRSKLREVKAREVRTIDMQQGNKRSRILAWRF